MAFDNRDRAKPYAPQEGDTLRAIAERETSAGNPMTWQQLARFNWGTDDEAEANAFLRDHLGARKRGPDNNFILSPDDSPREGLLIPLHFELRNLPVGNSYTLRVRRREAPPQFLGCCSLPGVTFAFNSSFVRPSVADHLQELQALATEHPAAKIMIFGHTDLAGDEIYNKKLSERRAWSVHAFITNDADVWEVLYNHPDEAWGVFELQEILADLGHYAGKIDGSWGPQTRAAARAFLGSSEDAPVQNDPPFRKRLFAAYMAGSRDIDVARSRFMEPGYMGCGEFNPMSGPEDDPEVDRRVTFYFFHPARLPNLPCAFVDTAPCHRQMVTAAHRFSPGFSCSYYDSLSRDCGCDGPVMVYTVRIRLFDGLSRPISGAPYRLQTGGHEQAGESGSIAGVSPEDGSWVEAIIPDQPGTAVLEWSQAGAVDPADANAAYQYRLEIHLDWSGTDDSDAAAEGRLHNLGYPIDAPLAENVRTFQYTYGLNATGELDGATRAELRSIHDACEPRSGTAQATS